MAKQESFGFGAAPKLNNPAGRKPGRYRVVCRVRDTTLLAGEEWPWVLRDERHLLRSERAWWVVVP